MSEETIYLLCIWTETQPEEDGTPRWRAVLEGPRTGQRWGFSDPEALVAFLKRERMGESASQRMNE